jgi:hypothetical protein
MYRGTGEFGVFFVFDMIIPKSSGSGVGPRYLIDYSGLIFPKYVFLSPISSFSALK